MAGRDQQVDLAAQDNLWNSKDRTCAGLKVGSVNWLSGSH